MEPGYHDRSWSLVLCLAEAWSMTGPQSHRPLMRGGGGGHPDTEVKGKELWLSPDGNNPAVLRCQGVPGTLHVWLDQKILLSS